MMAAQIQRVMYAGLLRRKNHARCLVLVTASKLRLTWKRHEVKEHARNLTNFATSRDLLTKMEELEEQQVLHRQRTRPFCGLTIGLLCTTTAMLSSPVLPVLLLLLSKKAAILTFR
jgi:hypothetical protein